jgi:hypothetical protein
MHINMKKTWNTPECRELNLDETMGGFIKEEGETTNYPCSADLSGADLGDGNFSVAYPCLSS